MPFKIARNRPGKREEHQRSDGDRQQDVGDQYKVIDVFQRAFAAVLCRLARHVIGHVHHEKSGRQPDADLHDPLVDPLLLIFNRPYCRDQQNGSNSIDGCVDRGQERQVVAINLHTK